MKQTYFFEAKGNEKFICSYCGKPIGLIDSMPEIGSEGICHEGIDNKPVYFHIHCALRLSSRFNEVVSDFIEKKTCG